MKEAHTVLEAGPFESLAEKRSLGVPGKLFLGKELGLTGCEVSLTRLPAGSGIPFVHAHRQNEEVYIVLRGEGTFYVDGREIPIREGSAIRVSPAGERSYRAGREDLYVMCIQAREGSLSQATLEDGFRVAGRKTSWM